MKNHNEVKTVDVKTVPIKMFTTKNRRWVKTSNGEFTKKTAFAVYHLIEKL